jgi:hypothetical protein
LEFNEDFSVTYRFLDTERWFPLYYKKGQMTGLLDMSQAAIVWTREQVELWRTSFGGTRAYLSTRLEALIIRLDPKRTTKKGLDVQEAAKYFSERLIHFKKHFSMLVDTNFSYEISKGVWCTLQDSEEDTFTEWQMNFDRVLNAAIERGNFEAQRHIWEEACSDYVHANLPAIDDDDDMDDKALGFGVYADLTVLEKESSRVQASLKVLEQEEADLLKVLEQEEAVLKQGPRTK